MTDERHKQPGRRRGPATLWGFPVEDREAQTPVPSGQGDERGKRGIALIIAIMVVSIMMLFTTDMILTSQVNLTLATEKRDNLKAEYMAKSAFNAATLLISADFAYDLFQVQQNPKGQMTDGFGEFWGALNGLPIGGETADMMSQFQQQFDLNSVMDSGVMDQLKLFDGVFTLNVSDEGNKINVNDCFNSRCSEVMLMLDALFSCPAEKAFLDQKKLDGHQLAYRIKDYIDKDSRAEDASGYNDEDDPYSKRTPKQQAKNAPLDSISELRMIDGWDEDMQAVFAPFITAFPLAQGSTDRVFKLNLNTASRAMLQCLFPESKGECADKSTLALTKRNDDQTTLGQPGEKIADVLRDTLCYTGGDGDPGSANNRANWFQQRTSVFRIEATGAVGSSVKTLTAVVQRVMPDVKKNEKATYRILYWKMI